MVVTEEGKTEADVVYRIWSGWMKFRIVLFL